MIRINLRLPIGSTVQMNATIQTNMKTKAGNRAALLGALLCLSPAAASVRGAGSDGEADAQKILREARLPSAAGPERAFNKPIYRVRTFADGRAVTQKLAIVYAPRIDAVWTGPAEARCFVLDGRIVGVFSEPGGDLVFRRSVERLAAARPPGIGMPLERELRRFAGAVTRPGTRPIPDETRVSLGEIAGPAALSDLDGDGTPEAVTVLGVALDRRQILITSLTAAGKTVDVVLDRQLRPVIAAVDGVRVFEDP